MTIALFVGGWLACGTLAYGFDNAYFRRNWPDGTHGSRLVLAILALGSGPASLLGFALFMREGANKPFRGWML